ncbi:MAG: hypothetical protein IJ620_04105 [Bacteroidales bacterium]|nr:hypothetical protein [Bacteroidales bacterium]
MTREELRRIWGMTLEEFLAYTGKSSVDDLSDIELKSWLDWDGFKDVKPPVLAWGDSNYKEYERFWPRKKMM